MNKECIHARHNQCIRINPTVIVCMYLRSQICVSMYDCISVYNTYMLVLACIWFMGVQQKLFEVKVNGLKRKKCFTFVSLRSENNLVEAKRKIGSEKMRKEAKK